MPSIAPSFNEIVTVGTAEATSLRPDIKFSAGNASLAMMHGAAATADLVIGQAAQWLADCFYDSSKGAALDRLVSSRTGIARLPASQATVTLQFARTSAGAAVTIPIGTEVRSAPGPDGNVVSFLTTAGTSLTIGSNGPVTAPATAIVTGRNGNVALGKLTKVSGLTDSTVTVTNPAAAAGGSEKETDEVYVARARSARNRIGTIDAFIFAARTVAGVATASAIEDTSSGICTLYIGDAAGNSTLQMVAAVKAAIEPVRSGGVRVEVVGGIASALVLTAKLTLATGYAAQQALLQQAIATQVEKLSAGQTIYIDQVKATMIDQSVQKILAVTFTAITLDAVAKPIADLTPAANQTVRLQTLVIS